jgi:hypothetical protein
MGSTGHYLPLAPLDERELSPQVQWATFLYDMHGKFRARLHCRFVLPLIHFIPYSLTYSVINMVPLFLNRQCERTPGELVWDTVAAFSPQSPAAGQPGNSTDAWDQVRKTLSWPRIWANFSLLYSQRNVWAN